MSTSPLGPDDVRAAAELHRELEPEYRDAVVESFLDRVGKEIDARVDQRLAAAQPQPQPQHRPQTLVLAISSIALGIPLTAIISAMGHGNAATELVFVWLAIALINVTYMLGHRIPPPRR
jgi:hypothetical protein